MRFPKFAQLFLKYSRDETNIMKRQSLSLFYYSYYLEGYEGGGANVGWATQTGVAVALGYGPPPP